MLSRKVISVAPKVMECCSKIFFCSKSDGVLLQNKTLLQKCWRVAPKQAFAPKVMECCSKTNFWSKSYGVLLQSNTFHVFQHTSYVPKPQFWPRIGSPWLGLSSNSARMNPTASRNLFKPLPALREPISGPKYRKKIRGRRHGRSH